MRRAAPFPLATLLALCAALPAAAALQWDATEVSTKVCANDSAGRAQFAFYNAGDKPITITGIHPGCGCTVPALDKSTYAPGERGVLTIDFHPGSREGLNRIPIDVSTDDGAFVRLQFVADIEPIVAFDTRFVFWKGAEARTPKRMRLTFAEGQNARLAEVRSSNPEFTVAFRPADDSGRVFDLEVTPPSEVQNYTAITIRALLGAEQTERSFTVVARTM